MSSANIVFCLNVILCPPNGSDVQRRGRFRVPKPVTMLTPLSEARKRRAGAGPRPLLRRVGQRAPRNFQLPGEMAAGFISDDPEAVAPVYVNVFPCVRFVHIENSMYE